METVYKSIEEDLQNDGAETSHGKFDDFQSMNNLCTVYVIFLFGLCIIAIVVTQQARDITTEDGDGNNVTYRYPQGNNKLPLVLPDNFTKEEQAASTQAVEENMSLDKFNEWKLAMPKSSEIQLESYFLDDSEVKKKEVVFNSLHQKYLEDFKRRQADKNNVDAADTALNEDDAAQAAGHARYVKASTRSRRGRNPAATPR